MKSRFKPVTRLSVIFILAIVLSGSILTYFSINNISNLKELTEKRIIEEQRELYSRFSAVLQNKIDTITTGITNESGLIKDSLIKRAAGFDFIIQPLNIKRDGQFIFPNFEGIPERVKVPSFPEQFKSSFLEGEKAEFVENDFREAKENYLSCLYDARGSSDSVKSLNALGRIAVKSNDFENAIACYGLIITNYSSVSDENGYPYFYYALPQLLKIPGAGNSEKIIPVIKFSLEKMVLGQISLNYSTEGLLIQITEWLKGNTLNNSQKLSYLNEFVSGINKQLLFVNNYRGELTELLGKTNLNGYYLANNKFRVIKSFSGNNQEFFLINSDLNDPAGFLIDRNKLFGELVKADLLEGFEFDYDN